MSSIIDPETMYVDDLPTIWSPVQWELGEAERTKEIEEQGVASLLWAADTPEVILRLLLDETHIERVFEPPDGFDPEQQGDWNSELVTYQFKRPIKMYQVNRAKDYLYVEYDFGELGKWSLELEPERAIIERI